jgi:ribosomal protein S18 acetylase RimI-like enzyme
VSDTNSELTLRVSKDSDIQELKSWFETDHELRDWAGPNLQLPCTSASFSRDIFNPAYVSYSLFDAQNKLVAFGQCYERIGRCHLARLVVAPLKRGQGIAAELIEKLSRQGCQQLAVLEVSLFVYESNTSAIKAYEKVGFEIKDYPQDMPMNGCLYMVRMGACSEEPMGKAF